jgi:FlaG/FlaF family flagellin (archaellin)
MSRQGKFWTYNGSEERGLSNIVAVVILMLAAIGLGTAVYTQTGGLVGDVEQPPQGDVGVEVNGDTATVTLRSGNNVNDADIVGGTGVTVNDDSFSEVGDIGNVTGIDDVGDSFSVTVSDEDGNTRTIHEYTYSSTQAGVDGQQPQANVDVAYDEAAGKLTFTLNSLTNAENVTISNDGIAPGPYEMESAGEQVVVNNPFSGTTFTVTANDDQGNSRTVDTYTVP